MARRWNAGTPLSPHFGTDFGFRGGRSTRKSHAWLHRGQPDRSIQQCRLYLFNRCWSVVVCRLRLSGEDSSPEQAIVDGAELDALVSLPLAYWAGALVGDELFVVVIDLSHPGGLGFAKAFGHVELSHGAEPGGDQHARVVTARANRAGTQALRSSAAPAVKSRRDEDHCKRETASGN